MPREVYTKILSSLEKCFSDEDLSGHKETKSFIMFRNERLSFQVGIYNTGSFKRSGFTVGGELAEYITVREVASVPVQYPIAEPGSDPDFLREKPCLAPDIIRPVHEAGTVALPSHITQTLWFDVELPNDFAAGTYSFGFKFTECENVCVSAKIRVLDAVLPKQKLIHTEWFYTDCIAEAIHARPFSKRHWDAVENYLKVAVKNGINTILTPVFTPELDTYIGGERLTTQLVGITVDGENRYGFDFSQLDRWIALCKKCGVEYFEIPHLFTQWGAKNAPKFVAKVNGRLKRIFGWETDALGEEYRAFLNRFLPALIDCLRKNGVDKRCFFHVSDEPSLNDLDHYRACRKIVSDIIGDYPIIDALSDYDFYESGAVDKPASGIWSIDKFLENGAPGLWAYYCGNRPTLTGRCITMPTYRTRVLGVQLWKANIEGFLHWGYNFYHNKKSYEYVDPFGDTSAEFFNPSGDAFLVYPAQDGTAWESIRLNAMREATDDMRALDFLSEKKGRAYAEALIDEVAGMNVDFTHYPKSAGFLISLRKRIADEIE